MGDLGAGRHRRSGDFRRLSADHRIEYRDGRDLFQAPFRAGLQLNAYQIRPLRKALRLPRVSLLIADDVGLGKKVEAGLIVRELLLRRRIDLTVVVAPAGMIPQWQDESEAKFGLAFTTIER